MKRWLLRGLVAYLVLAAIGLGVGIGAIYHYAEDLPDNRALEAYVPPITTRLHAANGGQIG